MDLIRAAIKAIFYDYPIEKAYGMIISKTSKKSSFLEFFSRLACEEDDGFSTREMMAYKDFLLDLTSGRVGQRENFIQQFVELPLILSEEVLTKDNDDRPRVKYTNLLRWREIVKCTGEDLFTLSFLAKEDKVGRKDFFWPNVIDHNNQEINAIFDKGLTDIHSHFGGSIDAFPFIWIYLMNDVGDHQQKFNSMKCSFNPVAVLDQEYSFKRMATWCKVAAAIRVCLYKLLLKKKQLKSDTEIAAICEIGKDGGSEQLTSLKKEIDGLRSNARKTCDGVTLDYAIGEALDIDGYSMMPYCVYAGERQIEYLFFKSYQRKTIKGVWAELFYLYELIKIHLRKEFIFANEMSGLDNYNAFTSRADLFTKYLQSTCNLYAMQSGLRRDKDDYLETRITQNSLTLTEGEYWKGLFSREPFIEKEEMKKRISFVVQLARGLGDKKEHVLNRYSRKRKEILDDYHKIADYISKKNNAYQIVGLDVGGMELYYRPEVYGHVLRASKAQKISVTYHVGEEFYDLADGLRAIWELIQYTKPTGIDRFGHCLALGVNPETYYKRKHCTLTMPKQLLLDNMVWLLGFSKEYGLRIKPALRASLNNLANELFEKIGYNKRIKELNIADYYGSLFLRSDETGNPEGLDSWSKTGVLESPQADIARGNPNAVKLYDLYRLCEDIIEEGEKPTTVKFERDYVLLLSRIQKAMIKIVGETRICIEGCPSSNLQIGKLERYDCHPVISYCLSPDDKVSLPDNINLAICTDDKGTFATSLSNELSLLALAADKKYGWNAKTEKYFVDLIEQGEKYRFKDPIK